MKDRQKRAVSDPIRVRSRWLCFIGEMVPVFLLVISGLPGLAQPRYHLELAPGISYVPPMPLSVNQEGEERILLWARYETASFKLPLYYSVRLGQTRNKKGWEVEMNHLKIYLKNTTEEISRFSISHGYNQLFLNRLAYKGKVSVRIGAGVVLAHPESTVRGKMLHETGGILGKGYYLAGPAILAGVRYQVDMAEWLYLSFSGNVTAAWASVKVSEGRASVPIVAFQLQIAPGIRIPACRTIIGTYIED